MRSFKLKSSIMALSVLLLTSTTGCFVASSYDNMKLNIGFVGNSLQPEKLLVVPEPEILLKSQGCGRSGGLRAPPVILELVFKPGLEVTAPIDTILESNNQIIRPYKTTIVRGVVGGDRIDISLMIKCADLNGAILKIDSVSVEGRIHNIKPITFRHSSEPVTEWQRLHGQWWK